MTSFAKLMGFRTNTDVDGDVFTKNYYNINPEHWKRIRDTSLLLSDEGIGPKVIDVNESTHSIQYESVEPFESNEPPNIPEMSIGDIRHEIINLVDRLHSLGYGHGDLQLENLGFKNNKIYMLDHDTVYNIEDLYNGNAKWLERWIKIGFDWEGSNEDFVNTDYDTWNNDWIQSDD
jgi:hypothetical protein